MLPAASGLLGRPPQEPPPSFASVRSRRRPCRRAVLREPGLIGRRPLALQPPLRSASPSGLRLLLRVVRGDLRLRWHRRLCSRTPRLRSGLLGPRLHTSSRRPPPPLLVRQQRRWARRASAQLCGLRFGWSPRRSPLPLLERRLRQRTDRCHDRLLQGQRLGLLPRAMDPVLRLSRSGDELFRRLVG